MTRPLTIDVWSDVMCPFCYMGDALLAKALDTFPHKEQVEIRYRSYQLMPGLPTDSDMNATEILVKAKGIPRPHAIAMNKQVEARAAQVGLEYHLDQALVVNTRSAQRLSQFALAEGKQHARDVGSAWQLRGSSGKRRRRNQGVSLSASGGTRTPTVLPTST